MVLWRASGVLLYVCLTVFLSSAERAVSQIPEITMNPVSVTVTASDTLKLNCTARNNADAANGLRFAWVYNGAIVLRDVETMEFMLDALTTTSQLIIRRVSREDAGNYRCLVTNNVFTTDEVGSEDALVTVNFLPVVLVTVSGEAGPVFNLFNGRTEILRCGVDATPAPTLVEVVALLGDESTLLSNISGDGSGESNREEFAMLPITFSLHQSDIVYECSATNTVGTGTGSITVVVQDVPDMIDHTHISSTIVDILSVELSWVIPEDNNAPITYYNVSWCLLSSANACVPGTYSFMMLDVSGQTPGDMFRIQLPFEPNAMFSLGIVAANSAGVGVAPVFDDEYMFSTATPEQAAPTNLRTVVLTTTAVVYEWTLPALARGGDIVLGQITFTVVPAGSTTNLEVVVTTPLNAGAGLYGAALSGLTSGLLHNVSITAVFTIPDLTSTSLTFTFTPPAVEEALLPDAEVVIGAQNAESVSILWPGVTDDSLSGYEIDVASTPRGVGGGLRRRRQSTPVTFTAAPGATGTTIDTPPYSDVEATVFATFQPPGSPDVIRALLVPPVSFSSPEGRAGPPTGLRAESIGFTTVVFVWNSPSQPNGVITNYQIFFQKVGVIAGSRFLTNSVSNMFPYSVLVANTEYTFTVTALTNDGQNSGTVSDPERFRTRLGVFPPTVSRFQQLVNIQLFDLVINLSQQYGNIRYFQVVVTTSNTINTRTLGLGTSAISGAGYYVAFQGDFPTGVRPPSVDFTLGTGQAVPHSGTVFTNAVLNASTNYYVFVRAFSSVDPTLSNDSSYSQVINSPGTTESTVNTDSTGTTGMVSTSTATAVGVGVMVTFIIVSVTVLLA